MTTQSGTTTIAHAVTVAEGAFAPGHLGELTQYLPFELVDDVLDQTRTVQRRLRDLLSRAGVYFVLELGMFPGLGYCRVWGKLTAGLAGLEVPHPSEKALRDLRRRLGPASLKALFEIVAGPLAQPRTPGVRFGGLRTVAFDGCNSLKIPDTSRNQSWLGKIRYRMGLAGYPALRVMAPPETGTRGLLGAAVGSAADRDEAHLARRLLHLLGPGMLVRDDGRPAAATAVTAIGVTVRTPPLSSGRPRRYTPGPAQAATAANPPPADHRDHHQPPPRDWTPRELAQMLDVHPRPLATQLREWSLLGFFTRTGLGTYRLNTPTPPSSTTEPDP